LSERERRVLEQLRRRQTSEQRLVRRVQIILAIAEGLNNEQAARQLGLQREQVRLWRSRWLAGAGRLAEIAALNVEDKPLGEAIEALLQDAPRPGVPGVFSAEQIAQILALACEDPQATGQPFTHWSQQSLAQEAVRRGIVERISARSVGKFLKPGRPQAASQPLLAQPASCRS
jgi:putative transposase